MAAHRQTSLRTPWQVRIAPLAGLSRRGHMRHHVEDCEAERRRHTLLRFQHQMARTWVRGDPPVHTGGEHPNRPNIGAPVVDEATRKSTSSAITRSGSVKRASKPEVVNLSLRGDHTRSTASHVATRRMLPLREASCHRGSPAKLGLLTNP